MSFGLSHEMREEAKKAEYGTWATKPPVRIGKTKRRLLWLTKTTLF